MSSGIAKRVYAPARVEQLDILLLRKRTSRNALASAGDALPIALQT